MNRRASALTTTRKVASARVTDLGSGEVPVMKAAVVHGVGELAIEDVELDDPWAHEVVVRTAACGVCRSDLHFLDGHYATGFPMVPGHEAAGVVEAVGSEVRYVQVGDPVIACMSVFCGQCVPCTNGRPVLCKSPEVRRGTGDPPRLRVAGEPAVQLYELGAHAQKMLVHESALVKIRPDMPLDRAALIGCAVTTGFGAVANTAKVPPGATVAVIGCGGVGLSAVNGASIIGAERIIAVDVQAGKLEQAQAVGATDLIDASLVDPVEAVLELTGGGAAYTFEALGRRETVEQAFRMLPPGGVATVIGMVPQGQMVEVHAADLLDEKVLQGSNMGSNQFRVDMPWYVDLYLDGRLHLDLIATQSIRLDGLSEAFDEMRSGAAGRVVVAYD